MIVDAFTISREMSKTDKDKCSLLEKKDQKDLFLPQVQDRVKLDSFLNSVTSGLYKKNTVFIYFLFCIQASLLKVNGKDSSTHKDTSIYRYI